MPPDADRKQKPLRYVEMSPASDVGVLVATYWSFAVRALPRPDFTHRVWPDGCAGLVIARIPVRGVVTRVVGATTTAGEVPMIAGAKYWGIRFRPDAGAVCCQRDAAALRERTIDAHDCFGDALTPLVTALLALPDTDDATPAATILDQWVRSLLPHATRIDPLVAAAVDRIVVAEGTTAISSISAQLDVSARHLQRRFRRATGLTLKEYASIRRGRAVLKRLAATTDAAEPAGLSRVAADSGYADQSHLTRECSRLTSFTPASLVARLGDIAHDRLVD